MTRACMILHAKTHQELERLFNNTMANMPDMDIKGTSFQVSERGFSIFIFYSKPAKVEIGKVGTK